MREFSVGDVRVAEVDYRQIRESLQVRQAGIGEIIQTEVEIREFGQSCQMRRSAVGDGIGYEAEFLEVGEPVSCANPTDVTRGETQLERLGRSLRGIIRSWVR